MTVIVITLTYQGCKSSGDPTDTSRDAGRPHNQDGGAGRSTEKENVCTIESFSVEAPSLEGSLVNAPTKQNAKILLPPGYEDEPDTRYPVVYYVHGFSSDYRHDEGLFLWASEEMEAQRINEFIIVSVNSHTRLGGSFGVNSPVTGNWEEHITKEIISYVDDHYRTLSRKESRGITGLSMGGFVALNLGLKHPDIYNLVFASSPGVLTDDDIESAFDQWQREYPDFIEAYGAAFAYNLDLLYPHAEIPAFDGNEADNRIVEKWLDGFGNFDQKMKLYLEGSERLKSIAINYGSNDEFKWITRGCRVLANLLTENDIPNFDYEFNGGHWLDREQVKTRLLPYFSDNLEYGE